MTIMVMAEILVIDEELLMTAMFRNWMIVCAATLSFAVGGASDRQLVLASLLYAVPFGGGDPPENGVLRIELAAAAVQTGNGESKREDIGCGIELSYKIGNKVTVTRLGNQDVMRLAEPTNLSRIDHLHICEDAALQRQHQGWTFVYNVDGKRHTRAMTSKEAEELARNLAQGCAEVLELRECWTKLAHVWLNSSQPAADH